MYKIQSILVPPHFVCSGDGTWQIVILKTKIKPVSLNAAANCNKHILWSDDAMPTLFAQCPWLKYPIDLLADDLLLNASTYF